MTWIQTHTGRKFDFLRFKPEDIAIEDIAHALANIGRFGGHSSAFYSVAQHSVLVSIAIEKALREGADDYDAGTNRFWRTGAMVGLLHDASDCYVGDVTRPLKYAPFMAEFRSLEGGIQQAIYSRFNLPAAQFRQVVREADDRMLMTEARDLLGPPPEPWETDSQPYPEPVVAWSPVEAKRRFFERYYHLGGV